MFSLSDPLRAVLSFCIFHPFSFSSLSHHHGSLCLQHLWSFSTPHHVSTLTTFHNMAFSLPLVEHSVFFGLRSISWVFGMILYLSVFKGWGKHRVFLLFCHLKSPKMTDKNDFYCRCGISFLESLLYLKYIFVSKKSIRALSWAKCLRYLVMIALGS